MNYYEILGVSKNATQKEIRKAYKDLIFKYHPDRNINNLQYANSKTSEINGAYDVLSKATSRAQYDAELEGLTNTDNATTDTTSSTDTYSSSYQYTPPKYDSPQYNKDYYKEQYYKKYGNYSDATNRYTDYHRSKTPNSNYTYKNNFHDQFTDNLANSIQNSPFNFNLKGFILIFIIYLFIMIFSFTQITSILNKDNDTPSSDVPEQADTYTTTPSHLDNPYIYEEDIDKSSIPSSSTTDEDETTFDITTVIPEEDLIQIYKKYYSEDFNSYSEFKDNISDIYYKYYIEK